MGISGGTLGIERYTEKSRSEISDYPGPEPIDRFDVCTLPLGQP